MIRIHREGRKIVTLYLLLSAVTITLCLVWLKLAISIPLSLFFLITAILTTRFFRVPALKPANNDPRTILSPAEGKIVAIEKVNETDFLKEESIIVSIFMSIHNVHVNYFPCSGEVVSYQYHPGKYLLARNPKSSELNERASTVIKNDYGTILVRQIAGYVARRLICYAKQGQRVTQGDELGFIRFGSRVDIFLPPTADIKVNIGQKVHAVSSVIAILQE